MAKSIYFRILFLFILLGSTLTYGQTFTCPTTASGRANNFVATFHVGAARGTDGQWRAWGQGHGGAGTSATAPSITIVRGGSFGLPSAITASQVKFVSGGSNGDGSQQNELVALINSPTNAATNNRIYTLNSGAGIILPTAATSITLPTGVTSADVTSLYAGYGVIAIVANGRGYVYNRQLAANIYGDGTTTAFGTWGASVKSAAVGNPEITTFVSIRGATTAGNDNGVLVGFTSSGEIYTWGNGTYNGSAAATTYTRATLVTRPAAATGATVTLVGANHVSGNATLYAMFDNGEFWSIGNGAGSRLGNFTSTTSTTWVRVRKTATEFANVVYFTTQEHDGLKSGTEQNPGSVQMILSDGSTYGFGTDGGYILGVGLTSSTPSTDPRLVRESATVAYDGTTANQTAQAIEMGGHISFLLKKPSTTSQICIAGHGADGSLLGTTNSSFVEYFSTCATAGFEPCPTVAAITAANDAFTLAAGASSTTTVLQNNGSGTDKLGSADATTSNVTISQVSTTNAGVTVGTDGIVRVAAGTPAGTYSVTYQICENPQPVSGPNCSQAVATVTVTAPAVAGTIDCAKTQIITAPVFNQSGQKTLAVTINVTTAGCFSPISVNGSGFTLAQGFTQVCATTTGVQTFYIPVNYDGTALGTLNFTVGQAGSCTANLTATPKKAIIDTWTLECVPTVGPTLK